MAERKQITQRLGELAAKATSHERYGLARILAENATDPSQSTDNLRTMAGNVELMLGAENDNDRMRRIAQREHPSVLDAMKVLVPDVAFDLAHSMQAVQASMLDAFAEQNQAARRQEIADFGRTCVETERAKEMGKRKGPAATHEEADAEAKQHFVQGRLWLAEDAWSRAIELDPRDKKALTNRAHVRVTLGRRVRSLGLGYRAAGQRMLQAALDDATRALEIDPRWFRGVERLGDACHALGGKHALEACKVVGKALQDVAGLLESQGEDVGALHKVKATLEQKLGRAKAEAKTWMAASALLREGGGDPKKTLTLASQSLNRVVMGGLGAADRVGEGNKIVAEILKIQALLRLRYYDPTWRISDVDFIDVQITLRRAARCVQLDTVEQCEALRKLVFLEEPWSLWGLDRLDQAGKDFLPRDAEDPFKWRSDQQDEEDVHFKEYLGRNSDTGTAMSMSNVQSVGEMIQGEGPLAKGRDMTPHHLCVFSMTMLMRFIMSPARALSEPALECVMAMSHEQVGVWAGGEFIGLAIKVASGLGGFGIEGDRARAHAFAQRKGSFVTLASELLQSGDHDARIQRLLGELPVRLYDKTAPYELQYLLNSIYNILDGNLMSWRPPDESSKLPKEHTTPDKLLAKLAALQDKRNEMDSAGDAAGVKEDGSQVVVEHFARILANIYATVPLYLEMVLGNSCETCDVMESLGEFERAASSVEAARGRFFVMTEQESSFGTFVMIKYKFVRQRLAEKASGGENVGEHEMLIRVFTKILKLWIRMTPAEKAGLRWETYSAEKKEHLKSMGMSAPTTHAAAKEAQKHDVKGVNPSAVTPACNFCGVDIFGGMKLKMCSGCGLVYYCGNSRDCQKKDWPAHKGFCRENSKKKQGGTTGVHSLD